MKVRLSGPDLGASLMQAKTPSRDIVKRWEEKVEEEILDAVDQRIRTVGVDTVKRIAQRVQAAAIESASHIFETVVNVIDNPNPYGGIRGQLEGGSVEWKSLSYRYAIWKRNRSLARSPRSLSPIGRALRANNRSRFFVLTGRLRSYFNRSGPAIVRNRMGGIKVTVDLKSFTDAQHLAGSRSRSSNAGARAGGRDLTPLGRIHMSIFPRVSPSLLPGLASGRWSTPMPGRASLEETLFNKTTYDKLTGGRYGPYRPLVLPIVQFYILNRIPRDVRASVKNIARVQG